MSFTCLRRLKLTHHSSPLFPGDNSRDEGNTIDNNSSASGNIPSPEEAPLITFPADLPISDHCDEIISALHENQVIIVAGETGSGKSTQLPKIGLAAGFASKGMIGHTQPRRIAARAVATRIAQELGEPLAGSVGYSVRFDDKTHRDTRIKVMTDGILLSEVSHDRMLSKYDLIIIDEAHERSVNIDFLLGIIASVLPKRPDLRLIITSATVNTEAFAAYFTSYLSLSTPVPVINVQGRTYPVEIRYLEHSNAEFSSFTDDLLPGIRSSLPGDDNPLTQLRRAIDMLKKEDKGRQLGDILIFFASEFQIKQAQEYLSGDYGTIYHLLPLYSRLSTEEQMRIFASSSKPKIILATNVAETSLTVPGIRYVIDTGTARIARYSPRTKVMRLPIEPISQASAQQRSGRCGRMEPGVAIRLYSEQDFLGRKPFTEPEVMRSNVSSVLLQMIKLSLTPISAFPFIDKPKDSQLVEALTNLVDLGAISGTASIHATTMELTPIGHTLSALPVDPRLGRMLIAGRDMDALHEVLVIVAALVVGDIKLKPTDGNFDAATAAWAPFTEKDSDFIFYVNVFHNLVEAKKNLTAANFRRHIEHLWLHFRRTQEWLDMYRQLKEKASDLGWKLHDKTAGIRNIHQALMTGMLSGVGARNEVASHGKDKNAQKRNYIGIKGLNFSISPASSLYKKPPAWVMAFELVETHKVNAYHCGIIDPEWIEHMAPHAVKYSHSNQQWSPSRNAVIAWEKVLYYGLPIVEKRVVNYAKINPPVARELFIRHALVYGEWNKEYDFISTNNALKNNVISIENKLRTRIMVDFDEICFEFYDSIIPEDVADPISFDFWRKNNLNISLEVPLDQVIPSGLPEVTETNFPSVWKQNNISLEVNYYFSQTEDDTVDGVHIRIPLPLLPFISPAGFDWHIPGYRKQYVLTILAQLPKDWRRLIPAADRVATNFLAEVPARSQPFIIALAHYLHDNFLKCDFKQLARTISDIISHQLPAWLKIHFDVYHSSATQPITTGNVLRSIQNSHGVLARPISVGPEKIWRGAEDFPDMQARQTRVVDSATVVTFSALKLSAGAVSVCDYSVEKTAKAVHQRTMKQLLVSDIERQEPTLFDIFKRHRWWGRDIFAPRLILALKTFSSVETFGSQCVTVIINEALATAEAANNAGSTATTTALPYNEKEFRVLLGDITAEVSRLCSSVAIEAVRAIEQWNVTHSMYTEFLSDHGYVGDVAREVQALHELLINNNFIIATPREYLARLAVYAQAQAYRFETLARGTKSAKDEQRTKVIRGVEEEFRLAVPDAAARLRHPVFWLIQELRVSQYAQFLGTKGTISEKKILSILNR